MIIQNWFKLTLLDFEGKFIWPKWEKCVIFGPKINTFELFSKSFVFLKLCLAAVIKKWTKVWLSWILKENTSVQNGIRVSNVRTGGPFWLRTCYVCTVICHLSVKNLLALPAVSYIFTTQVCLNNFFWVKCFWSSLTVDSSVWI